MKTMLSYDSLLKIEREIQALSDQTEKTLYDPKNELSISLDRMCSPYKTHRTVSIETDIIYPYYGEYIIFGTGKVGYDRCVIINPVRLTPVIYGFIPARLLFKLKEQFSSYFNVSLSGIISVAIPNRFVGYEEDCKPIFNWKTDIGFPKDEEDDEY